MDATRHETNDVVADGEVVWFWRSDAGAKVAALNESDDRRWQPSMVTGKSTKETVKTIVQGMPAVAVYPWLLTRVLFAAHAASGATRIRHSLRPCSYEGGSLQKLGRLAPRECGFLSPSAVIPRHRFFAFGEPHDSFQRASGTPQHKLRALPGRTTSGCGRIPLVAKSPDGGAMLAVRTSPS
jgi:hypothetical protein